MEKSSTKIIHPQLVKPLISVITVVFNDKNHIESTIQSIILQNYDHVEFIVIDGGSTDGTIDILNKYANYIDTFLSEKDQGIYDAMNKGVSLTKGDWICFMNSGDTFYNEYVLSVISSYFSQAVGVIYGDTNCVYDFGKCVVKAKEVDYIKKNMPFCHQSSFVKRDLLMQFPFDLSYRYVADYKFFYVLYYLGIPFRRIDVTIATFDAKDGVSSKNKYKVLGEIIRVQSSHFSILNVFRLYIKHYKFLLAELISCVFPSFISNHRKNTLS